MVSLIENLKAVPNRAHYTTNPVNLFLYVFALNRRKKEGDRDNAYKTATDALKKKEYESDPDLIGQCASNIRPF